eukprot:TRINITY_DN75_c0_g1_i1.p1 TRINITY_DN75_c0_g1~~TRINITY_DN75_c0_g1_i1.p1  ORF type:complete len:483 (+),score=82.56 TRINITY_DN75_c0_g1_i1:243-1691(+)
MSATLSRHLIFLIPRAPYLDSPNRRLLPTKSRRARARGRTIMSSSLRGFPFSEASDLGQGLVNKMEGIIYTIADAAVSSSPSTATTTDAASQTQNGDWLGGLTNALETVLKILKDTLEALHVPYAYGFAIILLTVLVKGATFPLTKKQVESTMAVQNLQPKVKEIQQRYAGNQEMIQLETGRLYQKAKVNPLAGCLPTLATIPVWIGLYRALSNVANEGLLTEGFFWIPSLAGPTTVAARQNGSGISWLFPFVDGHPPLGWSDTFAYLVLPMLLVVSQYVSMQIMQPPQTNDPSQKTSQAVLKFLPLMIGYFALSVPSGLSLYWLTNNILSTTQQVWFRKLRASRPLTQKNIEPSKSMTEVKATSPKPVTDPNQPRRGERFKQIMAEEARRRKEREAAAKRTLEEHSPLNETNTAFNEGNDKQGIGQSWKGDAVQVNAYDHQTEASDTKGADSRLQDDVADAKSHNAENPENLSRSTSEHTR